jgi:Spy/CpxP family protein refolding chaperone
VGSNVDARLLWRLTVEAKERAEAVLAERDKAAQDNDYERYERLDKLYSTLSMEARERWLEYQAAWPGRTAWAAQEQGR